MTRQHSYGFEWNDTGYEIGTTYLGTPAIVASPVKTGTYALELSNGDEVGYPVGGATRNYLGFHFYVNQVVVGSKFLEFWSDTGELLYLAVAIGGYIGIYRGSTQLALSSRTIDTGGWYHIQVDYYPDESAGVCTVRVDGSEWVTYTGDTRDTTGTYSVVRLVNSSAGGYSHYYDNFVMNSSAGSYDNSWPGIVELEELKVDGAGDATELTASSGANYTCVDESPPNVADYVYSATNALRDLYTVSNNLSGGEDLGTLSVIHISRVTDGSGDLAATIKAGSTEDDGDTIAMTGNFAMYLESWPLNPDDSDAWEKTDIDSLQIGIETKA
jgi:hypothetical protein